MAEPTKSKKKSKKKAPKPRERKERRFAPKQTHTSILAAAGGMIGALVLGAGVYEQWINEAPHSYARWIVTGGVVILGAALWFGDMSAYPVRVGEAGIAVEKGSDLVRLAWYEIERISIEKGQLVAKGNEGLTLTIPLGAHPAAVAWILAEATKRVPRAMDVKGSVVDSLPKPSESDGEVLVIEDLQVAGKNCASSNVPISFERDARLCPMCAQVYHKDHLPKKCVTCGEVMSGAA